MNDPIQKLADALTVQSPLKLWSVLVTCLGDVSRSGTADVAGLTLSALIERMGLQPQAMRVALHRLKRDGWIESRREGRIGFHGLSKTALKQTGAVEDRIYGPAIGPVSWHLVGLPPDAPDGLALLPDTMSAIAISRYFALICGALVDVPDEWLVAEPSERGLPGWVQSVVSEAACEPEFAVLEQSITDIDTLPETPLDRFALRVLVLHGWRRLALRSNPAAEAAMGQNRAEITCRACVHDVLDRLGPVTVNWLQVTS